MELRFIADTGRGNLNESDRKAIRSHVMKGKNLGRWRSLGSRPRQEQLKQLKQLEHRHGHVSSSSSDSSRNTSSPNSDASQASSSHPLDLTTSRDLPILLDVPRKLGSAASIMSLADSVEPEIFDIVLRFSSIAKQLLFSIETCIFFDRRVENWVAPLAVDAAFLHSNISVSVYYYDVVLSRTPSRASQRTWYYHHSKTLHLLRDRLGSNNTDIQLSDSTVSVILSLAGQAFCAGDLKTATKHMEGIHRIIELRGGFDTFNGNEKLATEVIRCDLGMAIHSGTKSLLFTTSIHCAWPYPPLSLFLGKNMRNPNADNYQFPHLTELAGIPHDNQLTSAWNTMSDFCSIINLAAVSNQRITVDLFLRSMASVMYRLINMQFEPSSVSEIIRLGLLCFCCGVFLQWQRLGTSYPQLASSVKNIFVRLNVMGLLMPQRLALWLLMVGSVSVLTDSDSDWIQPQLRHAAASLELQSWNQVRKVLSEFMWIDMVHGKAGKRVFEAALPVHQDGLTV
ncbi:hypothetical protein F5X98DRAFT_359577 [Xylaria grammica]|nr:hypothetical protein F5X98DRAFT_359577 [Xylaria grammica]